jgi:hypothetical protein
MNLMIYCKDRMSDMGNRSEVRVDIRKSVVPAWQGLAASFEFI